MLHKSTIVVVLLATLIGVLLIVPGDMTEVGYSLPAGPVPCRYEHGWPAVFLERVGQVTTTSSIDDEEVPWLTLAGWSTEGIRQFHLESLVLDVALSVGVIAVIGLGLEWRYRRRRRWYQTSLVELFLAVTMLGLFLGWMGAEVRRIRHEASLVKSTKRSGDFELDLSFEGYVGPIWFSRLLGGRLLPGFQGVSYLSITYWGPETDDSANGLLVTADCIRDLGHLSELHIYNGATTSIRLDSELLHGLRRLRLLDIDHRFHLEGDLSALATLTSLRELNLPTCGITDAGLAHIGTLKNLRSLDLLANPITDAGLTHLSDLRRLESLDLTNCSQVTNRGILQLAPVTVHALGSSDGAGWLAK